MAVQNAWRASTSIATVGSSSTSSCGSLSSATAKRTRWVSPPESFCVRRSAKPSAPVSSRTSSTGIGEGYSEAIIVISSRTLRSRSSEPVCNIAPTAPSATASEGERPNSVTLPSSGASRPRSMSIVVDLPAPLGPSRATVSPAAMPTSMPRTASTVVPPRRKDFTSPRSSTSLPPPPAEPRLGEELISERTSSP